MQVSIVDAYCPHLGANLGVGGRVQGNCIECPFHGWQFDGETGQCVNIPYAEKVWEEVCCAQGKGRFDDSHNRMCCGYLEMDVSVNCIYNMG